MLDDEDRPVRGDLLEQRAGARRLLVGHAGHGLVHEQELGVLGDHHPDLEPLLLPVRERAGRSAGLARELYGLERPRDPLARLAGIAPPERGEDALRRPPQR